MLFQHVQAHSAVDPATREALRYREALLEGYQQLATRPLTTRTAEQVCSHIKGNEMTVRRVSGATLQSAASGEVIFMPPAPGRPPHPCPRGRSAYSGAS